jgi:hypothetical protein
MCAKYENGDGTSIEKAVKIVGVTNNQQGINAEYEYINILFGKENIKWTFISQKLISQNGIPYDEITFKLITNGKTYSYYFDISDFYLKNDIFNSLFPGLKLEDLFAKSGSNGGPMEWAFLKAAKTDKSGK